MAMGVNLAFLVPQAMMKGLTKLTFWESSGRGECQWWCGRRGVGVLRDGVGYPLLSLVLLCFSSS